MKKQLLFLFAALLPLVASAQTQVEIDGIWYNLYSDESKAEVTFKGSSWDEYNGEYSGTITIPATVTYEDVEYSVTSIGRYAFRSCSSLTAINIPEGVTSIERGAFYECSSLTSITIPEGVTSIGEYAFWNCSSLTAITIPEGVTSIGYAAFAYCRSLTTINIPEGVTSIGEGAFYECSSLTAITIPEGVTSIGDYAFYYCSSLKAITIPEGVTSIGYAAFYGCTSLTAITIPEGVTSIGEYAFWNCSSLTAITIPESVTEIGNWAFYGCSSLEQVTINCANVGDWFRGLSSLKEVVLGESVTSIGSSAFEDCSSLKTVINYSDLNIQRGSSGYGYVGYYADRVINVDEWIDGYAFKTVDGVHYLNGYIGNDTELTLPNSYNNNNYQIGEYAFYECSSLTAITLPEGVTSIGDEAFWACRSLTAITIPENSQLTSIGSSAFRDCDGLTSITIPEGVTSIGNDAFCGCSSLTSITIPESVTSIGGDAFYNCSSLTAITIPASVTSIGEGAFSSCDDLISIVVAEGNKVYDSRNRCNAIIETSSNTLIQGCSATIIPASVTSIGDDAFFLCDGLTSITIPASVTSIGEYAFSECNSLKSITLPEGVTSIGECAFRSCDGLTSITIPESVTSIGDYVFSGCSSLTSITIPESVTSIGDYAFYSCRSLTAINIPEGVTSIGNFAFAFCSLTTITCKAVAPPTIEGNTFYVVDKSIPVYVPAGSVKAYKVAEGWSEFTNISMSVPITHITLSQSSATLLEEESLTLTATVAPDNATDKTLTWSSSNPSVATVDNMGKVTAIALGTTTITATANDGSGVSAQCEVTVLPAEYILTAYIDGEVFVTDTLARGTIITLPDYPTKEGYTFSGWGEVPETMPAHDVTINATFIPNKYLVTFKIGDEVIASDSLEYQSAIVAPEVPEKEGYTFSGWGEVADSVPAHDLTYEGSYSINFYTLTYMVDGEIVKSDSIAYGTAITLLKEPTKEGYTFSGWGEVPETMPAHDVTINATFIPNKYLVTFKIGDEVIASDSLEYQSAIVAPEVPEKEGYTFSGWGEVADTVPAHDLTYEGSYSINSYTLTYMVDGNIYHETTVEYGTTIEPISEPTMEGHTFSGWSEVPETMPAEDVTIEGTFTVNKYLVTFMIDDVVLVSDSLEYGSTITLPSTPPAREGYTFSGWGEVAETVPANDVTYSAYYITNVYKVYYFVGAKLVNMVEVTYGEPIPEYIYEPTTEGDEFLGWIGEKYATMPAHDVTYIANIENGIDQVIIDNGQLTIYDLAGRKVLNTENLKGGIYIVNGKKTVIK